MEKLRNKVFLILVVILFSFLTTILIIFNFQSYNREKKEIENNLMRMENFEQPIGEVNKDNQLEVSNNKKIFMDSNIYTIVLDSSGEISEIISHTANGDISDEVRNYANKIVESNKQNTKHIGNLYFTKYSYSYINSNALVIEDNSNTTSRLKNELITSIIIFLVMGGIIIYTSKKLTDWIIKPAKEALEKQKQFIADASHELKTPVAVIMASSEALEDDFNQKWIDNIKSESERMNQLIVNLLNLSKLENNDNKELFTQNNLSKIIENSCLTFESLAYEKKIKFKTDIENDINFKCDMYQIKQLTGILIDNAIKHSDENGEITIKLVTQKNDIILEVTNLGKSIPKEMQEKIFERFYRADESRNRDDNRYGLGLAIAKNIVQNHGGKIGASSSDGKTTFKVDFRNTKR